MGMPPEDDNLAPKAARTAGAEAPLRLLDPRLDGPALRIGPLGDDLDPESPQRTNFFTLIWVEEGSGSFWADLACHPFGPRSLLFFAPYQILRLTPEGALRGRVIQFHANFFCIETYHEEVGCNGVLFNDPYGVPAIRMDPAFEAECSLLVGAMERELLDRDLAHAEALVSYLKILLVRAARLKLEQQQVAWEPRGKRPIVIDDLKGLIESEYRALRKPADYAARLHLSPKALARLAKAHLGMTITELIRDKVIRQAKWELLHTLRPVKQVARGLGFDDVYYFSRLFKQATGCSPTSFRAYETEIRGGRNLSINARHPSIPEGENPPEDGSG
jgi:AraC family transcriptional activator of pobA